MNHTRILVLTLALLSIGSLTVYGVPLAGAKHQASSTSAIILLSAQPLSSYTGDIPGYAATMPAPGAKLDLDSPAAIHYASFLASQRSFAKMYLAQFAPEVTVTYEYSTVLNGLAVNLNGADVKELKGLPGVVDAVNSFAVHTDMNRSPTLIGAPTLWAADGGQANAGAGIKIGIIDTGIDFTHPFLTDNSLLPPAGFPKCDALDSSVGQANVACKYVSDKVIVAKMFCTQAVCVAFDAQAKQDHGSHVSGTAAGVANTCAPFVSCTMSGIAPKAFLGAYNVFPGNVTDASSADIAMAVDAAVADGMDVLNLSLGGTPTQHDPLVTAVNDATDAGVVVAIAAGNAGPSSGTIESPGIAEKVITVGASTNPHFVGIPVSPAGLGTVGAALGSFNDFGVVSNAAYSTTSPTNGCTAIKNNIAGEIALIARGACTFSTKIRNAQTAGATGVIVYNNVLGDPTAMGQDGTPNQPTIPAVMVSRPNGLNMASATTKTVSIDGTTRMEFFSDGPSADIIAGFSSRGPAFIGNTLLKEIKPDVVAPGVNVYSSILMSSCASPPCFAFFQGTSMATPHVAGAAALLKQLHPNWSPAQIKSALVQSAARPVKSSSTGNPLPNPMDRGSGRINLAAASQVTATISVGVDTSLDYGQLSSQGDSAQLLVKTRSVASSSVSYTVSVVPAFSSANQPSITVDIGSVTLASGGSANIQVTVATNGETATGDYFGDIVLSGGTIPLNIPYWVEITP